MVFTGNPAGECGELPTGRNRGKLAPMKHLSELRALLERRLSLIGDHAWRDRDAAGHLAALAAVSTEIAAWTSAHRASVDAQLRHYLANASYSTAAAHLDSLAEDTAGA